MDDHSFMYSAAASPSTDADESDTDMTVVSGTTWATGNAICQPFSALPSTIPSSQSIIPILPAPTNSSASLTLVGAGPGSPGLLTLAAAEAIRNATLIISDRLVPMALLQSILGEPPTSSSRLSDAEGPWPHVLLARKVPGRATQAQDEIHDWIVRGLIMGHRVVRLKGGDPFVFGRGGEEILHVREALKKRGGLPANLLKPLTTEYPGASVNLTEPDETSLPPMLIIPGLSSSLSAPLMAGIPVTHRGVSDQILIATGQRQDGSMPTLPSYCATRTTVLLMSMTRIDALVGMMVGKMGYPPLTPAAIIEKASCGEQRVVSCVLRDAPGRAAEMGISSHATLVVGDVANVLV
ncbi:tetrapyrrole methylase [Chytridium lagenaria]|nr:tetrapyrrole methylase [Chytridium lagenaria]